MAGDFAGGFAGDVAGGAVVAGGETVVLLPVFKYARGMESKWRHDAAKSLLDNCQLMAPCQLIVFIFDVWRWLSVTHEPVHAPYPPRPAQHEHSAKQQTRRKVK